MGFILVPEGTVVFVFILILLCTYLRYEHEHRKESVHGVMVDTFCVQFVLEVHRVNIFIYSSKDGASPYGLPLWLLYQVTPLSPMRTEPDLSSDERYLKQ